MSDTTEEARPNGTRGRGGFSRAEREAFALDIDADLWLNYITQASEKRRYWDAELTRAMRQARSFGYTLQQIADAAGLTSRQRAHQLTKETK